MRSCAVLLCVGLAVVAAHHHKDHHGDSYDDIEPSNAASDPLTVSPSGQFRGSWLRSRRGRRIQAYRGIRYAEPPVGELRFQPPQMITSYKSEVDARQDGPACPQPVRDDYPVDEDCLRLNVYRPDGNNVSKLPVVVFMHAGGFYAVSGRSDVAGPHYLLDRDVVLVTINYRLGSLGFLSTGDALAPGNNGFKDQVAALRWVRRNVAAFGGDPAQVTIAGYSAGSFSVMLHTISPMSKGLFHRAMSMSGSPISQIEIPRHQRRLADKQARLLNCSTASSQAIIDCLKTKTAKELGDSLTNMFEYKYDPVLVWVPVQELDFGQERFLPRQPLQALCSGDLQRVPYIVSQTQDEFFWKAYDVTNDSIALSKWNGDYTRFANIAFYLGEDTSGARAARLRTAYSAYFPPESADRKLRNDSATTDALGKLYSDAIIGFGVHRLVNLLGRHSQEPVYYYEFGYVGDSSHYVDPVTNKPTAAAHHDDLLYLFNVSASFPPIPLADTRDSHMVDKMTALVYNFARYGDPNPRSDTPELSGLSWPQFKPEERKYLRVDEPFAVQQKLFEDRFKVWEELFPIDYQKCT